MILAANWKMHMGPDEARAFAAAFLARVTARAGREIVIFPPAVSVEAAARAFGDAGRSDVTVGVQDVHWEPKGAFTGATSVPLARAAGARAVLIGHSERRHVFGESDADTRRKLAAVVELGLRPFLCVGELLSEREAGATESVVLRQLRTACQGLTPEQVAGMVVAYEPVWAIGTGRTATPEDASRVHAVLREALLALGGAPVPILYGGSVNAGNARVLMTRPLIDGLLVGGASLDPDGWAEVVEQADLS